MFITRPIYLINSLSKQKSPLCTKYHIYQDTLSLKAQSMSQYSAITICLLIFNVTKRVILHLVGGGIENKTSEKI